MDKKKKYISNLKKAWRDEMLSAANYRALAEQEKNPERKSIFTRMAEAEDRHAERWAARLKELGIEMGSFRENPIELLRKRMLLKSSPARCPELPLPGEE